MISVIPNLQFLYNYKLKRENHNGWIKTDSQQRLEKSCSMNVFMQKKLQQIKFCRLRLNWLQGFYIAMDSSAAFKERAKTLGLPEAAVARLADSKLATCGQFAVLSSFQPGSSDEQPFVDALAKVSGTTPEAAELACWRRLYYECHTAAMSDLRARLERKDDDGPRKLLMPERIERLERAKRALVGITIDTQLEPAHRLVDQTV